MNAQDRRFAALGKLGGGGIEGWRRSQEKAYPVDRFLWNAALKVLKEFPLHQVHMPGGIIETQEKVFPSGDRVRFRVLFYDGTLHRDAFEVWAYKKVTEDKHMSYPLLAQSLKERILHQARRDKTHAPDDVL